MTDLGTLGGTSSRAIAISVAGVVGASTTATNRVHAFFWTAKDGLRDLGTLGGDTSEAWGINVRGEVIGQSSVPSSIYSHAFLWTEKDGMRDLGSLGGSFSQAFGIADSGVIVGHSTLAGDALSRAVLWSPERGKGQGAGPQIRDLGTLGGSFSRALGISTRGDVVGLSNTTGDQQVHAFRWTEHDSMQDLGTLGGTYSIAVGINARGETAGAAAVSNGVLHGVVYR
jgi:probable HAF family extracellular repeat protein